MASGYRYTHCDDINDADPIYKELLSFKSKSLFLGQQNGSQYSWSHMEVYHILETWLRHTKFIQNSFIIQIWEMIFILYGIWFKKLNILCKRYIKVVV